MTQVFGTDNIKKIGGNGNGNGNGAGMRFRVRWAVDGSEHCKSFKARPPADGFLAELKDAVRDRRPFNPRTGLPGAETAGAEMVTWYEHARSYTEAKWAALAPGLPPVGRRSPGHRHHRPHRQGTRRTRGQRIEPARWPPRSA